MIVHARDASTLKRAADSVREASRAGAVVAVPGDVADPAHDASRVLEDLRGLATSRYAVHPLRWGVGVTQSTSVGQPHAGPMVDL